VLNDLRNKCGLYFHGHSVGGTNPSLLEAMACGAKICAHKNSFNYSVLGDDAYYFSSSDEVAELINTEIVNSFQYNKMIDNNINKIKYNYSWEKITNLHVDLFNTIIELK
jgi:glycosyltransferase involved in cell wall biosynthesis